jgi:indolepyruvate ferredoxin oxidoreductase beta subunit
MKQDIILAGVGGQGILSIAYVIDQAALKRGLNMKQAEVHGMAQRGGAVQSHLRVSDQTIYSDLIPKGQADLVLSVEPLEALRYADYLHPDGMVITGSTPLVNITDYPPIEGVLERVRQLKRSLVIDSAALAQKAGSAWAQNMVMLGAASRFLILEEADLKEFVGELFGRRGAAVVEANLKAFDLGREAAAP